MEKSGNVVGIFNQMLTESTDSSVFYARTAMLLQNDPYFFPGYLEMIWHAEEIQDFEYKHKTTQYALAQAATLLSDATTCKETTQHWVTTQKTALLDFLELATETNELSFWQRTQARLLAQKAARAITITIKEAPIEPHCLQKVATVDHAPLMAEVAALAPFWWQVYTARTFKTVHHQHTRAMIIRKLTDNTAAYQAADGVHESIATHYSPILERTHQTVLQLANELNIALGRVAVVMMKPHAQAYRHYDSEQSLVNRNRYHLVLQAGAHNFLSSGLETVNAQPGEVWLFDNKAMHRAHNKSDIPRVHVIFDGYPIAELPK